MSVGSDKTRMVELLGGKRISMTCSAILAQNRHVTNVTDRQTDRQTDRRTELLHAVLRLDSFACGRTDELPG